MEQIAPLGVERCRARKVAPVAHHAAMDYRQLLAFMKELRALNDIGPPALEGVSRGPALNSHVTASVPPSR